MTSQTMPIRHQGAVLWPAKDDGTDDVLDMRGLSMKLRVSAAR
jgi:hypothetical protein